MGRKPAPEIGRYVTEARPRGWLALGAASFSCGSLAGGPCSLPGSFAAGA